MGIAWADGSDVKAVKQLAIKAGIEEINMMRSSCKLNGGRLSGLIEMRTTEDAHRIDLNVDVPGVTTIRMEGWFLIPPQSVLKRRTNLSKYITSADWHALAAVRRTYG